MSIFGGKTKSTTKVDVPPPTPEERALTKQQLFLADAQQQNLSKFTDFTADLFAQFMPVLAEQVNKFLPQQNQLSADILGFASKQVGAQGALLDSELAAIQRGVALSPDQEKLITDSANAAISTGLSDINRMRDEGLQKLAQETAIGRGLRPEDSPIQEVGGDILNESNRLGANLITSIRGQEAQQKLAYPIEAGRFISERTQAQQALGADTSKFIEELRQAAFNNRLNLTSVTGNVGATASQIGPSPTTLEALNRARIAASKTTETTKNSPGLLDIISGIGSAAGGVGGGLTGAKNVGWIG